MSKRSSPQSSRRVPLVVHVFLWPAAIAVSVALWILTPFDPQAPLGQLHASAAGFVGMIFLVLNFQPLSTGERIWLTLISLFFILLPIGVAMFPATPMEDPLGEIGAAAEYLWLTHGLTLISWAMALICGVTAISAVAALISMARMARDRPLR